MNRRSSKVCKYAVIGCPIKRCPYAHCLEQFYSRKPMKEKVEQFRQITDTLIQRSDTCPYADDCPKTYCPYDREKYPISWYDESPPDFDQPLVWKHL